MKDKKTKKTRGSIVITGISSDVDLKKLSDQYGKGKVRFKKAKKYKKKAKKVIEKSNLKQIEMFKKNKKEIEPKKPDPEPKKSESKKPDPELKKSDQKKEKLKKKRRIYDPYF